MNFEKWIQARRNGMASCLPLGAMASIISSAYFDRFSDEYGDGDGWIEGSFIVVENGYWREHHILNGNDYGNGFGNILGDLNTREFNSGNGYASWNGCGASWNRSI